MTDFAYLLAVLQHGDSFFPSGSVSFSSGLEWLVEQGRITGAADAQSFVSSQLRGRWVSFERAVIIAAFHASRDLDALVDLDNRVEIQTPAAEIRSSSRRLGDAMLSVFARLGIDEANDYRVRVKRGEACGHLAVMQGFLWARAGHDEAAVVALSAHTFVTGLLAAGIRLGCITHLDAQRILRELRPEIIKLCKLPAPSIDDLSTCTIEAEIAVIRNAGREVRLFAS